MEEKAGRDGPQTLKVQKDLVSNLDTLGLSMWCGENKWLCAATGNEYEISALENGKVYTISKYFLN